MRAGKVLLLVAVLCVGSGLQTALALRDRVSLGAAGCRVLGGRFEGPSHAFESQTAVDLPAGARLRVDNAFGAVKVRVGDAGRARVSLRTVVYLFQQEKAKELADKVQLAATLAGDELHVRTNREEFEHGQYANVGLETHLDLVVPPGTPVTVANSHGAVELTDVASADVDASFDSVRVERVSGAAHIKVRHADAYVAAVGGALSLEGRHGDAEVRDAGAPLTIDVEHGDVTLLRTGAVEAKLRHGDLKAEQVQGTLTVRAEHASVEGDDVRGAADVETAFRDVGLRRIAGDVRVIARHGDIELEDVSGRALAQLKFGGVKLLRVKGAADVEVEHGGLSAEALESGARVRASGDGVTLDGFRGAVEVRAQRGDVSLTPTGAIVDNVFAEVENGGVTLVVPGGSRGQVDAQAQRGEIALIELPGVSMSSGDPERASGVLGGGGPALTLRTRHGDIRLEGRAAQALQVEPPR
jgi:DUF4097 and DUF4098 domain-containing protein YvlB